MRSALFVCALLGACASFPAASPDTADYALTGGRWFDGAGFVSRTAYISGGVFVEADTARQIVDLDGGHVIPPFCEGHAHTLGDAVAAPGQIDRYLRDGVFYVKVMSNLPRLTEPVRAMVNRPDSVDVLFANGGFTGPGGHPIPLRERILAQGGYPGFTRETLADHAWFEVADASRAGARFASARVFRPDFIKIFLLHSDAYEARLADPESVGRRGLSPAAAAAVVRLAHQAGLTVSAHVETAADFRNAILAGADEIAHIPGYNGGPDRLTAEDAALAAGRGVSVVTTLSVAATRLGADHPRMTTIRGVQADNLRRLRDAGVRLVVGSDNYWDTSAAEAAWLRGLGVLSNADLLTLWTANCSGVAGPGRTVGRLDAGFEANLLVLDGDPLEDWSATARIVSRVKSGQWLGDGPPAVATTRAVGQPSADPRAPSGGTG